MQNLPFVNVGNWWNTFRITLSVKNSVCRLVFTIDVWLGERMGGGKGRTFCTWHGRWQFYVCVGLDLEYFRSAIKQNKTKTNTQHLFWWRVSLCMSIFSDNEPKLVFILLSQEKPLSIHVFISPHQFRHLLCTYSMKDTVLLSQVSKHSPNHNASVLLTHTQGPKLCPWSPQ